MPAQALISFEGSAGHVGLPSSSPRGSLVVSFEESRRLPSSSPRGSILSSPCGTILRSPRQRSLALLVLVASALLALVGCSRQSRDVVAEPTPSVPTDVVFYTHVLYGGDDAYLVDGQWFRPASTGWVVFTKEPLELRLIRESAQSAGQGRAMTWWPL
jgi:hypothetical protein